ncbi:cell-cycle control medial ring component, partial [Staphylotrichum tortipilum]
MATELAFAKSFLSLLDSKPCKLSPDHVEDPRSYPGSSPYTVPRHASQKAFSKPSSSIPKDKDAAPADATTPSQQESTIPVTLVSPRNPPLTLSLPPQPPSTSLAQVKELAAQQTGLPLDKIKLLWAKKPVGDSKLLRDLVSPEEGQGGLEIGLMVLGGAAALAKATPPPAPVVKQEAAPAREAAEEKAATVGGGDGAADEEGGKGVLATGQFWEELRGFVQARVGDEGV